MMNINELMSKHYFQKFNKSERSSFRYWYYHWKAFNLVAYYLNVWKFKYLFHDIEKPWLKLFLPYEKVQKIHRKYNAHHIPKLTDKPKKVDWEAAVIDWECSRFTKIDAPMTAYETYQYFMKNRGDRYDLLMIDDNVPQILKQFGLNI